MDCLAARLLCPRGFSRQEYWSGLLCPIPGYLPYPGIEPMSLTFPCICRWVLYHTGGSAGKEFACNVGELGLIPELGRSPGEGKGYLPEGKGWYSGLENSMDCIAHGGLKELNMTDFPFFTTNTTWEAHLVDI